MMPMNRRSLLTLGAGSVLVGCAATPRAPGEEWHEVRLPGKASTAYRNTHWQGRPAVEARAERSASMWRRRVQLAADRIGEVELAWWVPALLDAADVGVAESEDAPVRVLFGFGGDVSRLPMRTRMMFELAEALTGESPPYATLAYLWERRAPVESIIVNPRTDRVRKLVLDSGIEQLGRWREHRRDLAADFQRAFGEAPGPLQSMALMTDSDNTGGSAQAWYGSVRLL